jgi:hypothetical protein
LGSEKYPPLLPLLLTPYSKLYLQQASFDRVFIFLVYFFKLSRRCSWEQETKFYRPKKK